MYRKYLWYLARHKWFVFLSGLKRKAPLWNLIIHDWSKFLPSEFFPYANYFYGSKDQDSFNRAWNYHQKRNKHHWQYWVYTEDSGATITLEMPEKYRREMLADWDGAGMAIHGIQDTKNWYIKNRAVYQFHPETRKKIEADLLQAE